jgi:hypothetical protein
MLLLIQEGVIQFSIDKDSVQTSQKNNLLKSCTILNLEGRGCDDYKRYTRIFVVISFVFAPEK